MTGFAVVAASAGVASAGAAGAGAGGVTGGAVASTSTFATKPSPQKMSRFPPNVRSNAPAVVGKSEENVWPAR